MTLLAVVALAFLASFAGGFLPSLGRLLTRERLSRALAFRSGLLLAVAFGDVLPEAWAGGPRIAGLAAFAAFALCYAAETVGSGDSCHEAVEGCTSHTLGGAAIAGIVAHSFVDGVNLSAASLAGLSPLLAAGVSIVVCHLADGFTLATMFGRSGFGRPALLSLLASAGAATAAGAALAGTGAAGLSPSATSALLGFAGGCFVYVGASDVLPRLHRDRDPAALGLFAAGACAIAGLHVIVG